jgi:glycosyltransferase involved in cell wall biosynthesis
MKFVLVSHVLPPLASGQAIILYRLLKELNPRTYCMISWQNQEYRNAAATASPDLTGKHYHLRSDCQIRSASPLTKGVVNTWFPIVMRAVQIARVARNEKCDAIVACTADLFNLPAGYLASRLLSIRFYPYIFDYYSQQWIKPLDRLLAGLWEPLIIKGAAGVIVPNEFMQREYQLLYGVDSTVIHNICDLSAYTGPPGGEEASSHPDTRIVYTGAVYQAHYDAFRNLIAGMKEVNVTNLNLHLYSAQSAAELEEHGITGGVILHRHELLSAIPTIQKKADILFLPMAFTSPYPEVIRTSSPGKMGEYLAAGRPILAHAPPDSFISWYLRTHQCGVVVDRNDPGEVAKAITSILADREMQRRIRIRAKHRASLDFSLAKGQAAFKSLLGV